MARSSGMACFFLNDQGGPPYYAYQGFLVLSLDLEVKCPQKIFCLDLCCKNFQLCAHFFSFSVQRNFSLFSWTSPTKFSIYSAEPSHMTSDSRVGKYVRKA